MIYSVHLCVCFRPDFFFFFFPVNTADPPPSCHRALWARASVATTRWQVSQAQVGRWERRRPLAGGLGAAQTPRSRLAGSPQPASEPGRLRSDAVPLASARGSQRAPRSGWVWGRREAEGERGELECRRGGGAGAAEVGEPSWGWEPEPESRRASWLLAELRGRGSESRLSLGKLFPEQEPLQGCDPDPRPEGSPGRYVLSYSSLLP